MKVPGHLEIEEIRLAPGQEWTDTAAAWRFVRVHSGAAYWLAATSRSLSEGEMILMPPEANGTVHASQIGEVILHTFEFSPDLLCGFLTVAERQYFESGGAGAFPAVRFLPSTHPVTQQFAWIAGGHSAPNRLSARIEVLGLVAAVFGEELTRHHTPAPLGATALDRFHQLITHMPDVEMTRHSPEDLARLCGCSPRHFNRLFRKHFGVSARERQTELRLLKARQLLSNADMKIIQAADATGYRNLSLFNALFKKRFGMTPSQWRHQAQAQREASPAAAQRERGFAR